MIVRFALSAIDGDTAHAAAAAKDSLSKFVFLSLRSPDWFWQHANLNSHRLASGDIMRISKSLTLAFHCWASPPARRRPKRPIRAKIWGCSGSNMQPSIRRCRRTSTRLPQETCHALSPTRRGAQCQVKAIIPDLPPAVILDVDETVVSNVDFQLTFRAAV